MSVYVEAECRYSQSFRIIADDEYELDQFVAKIKLSSRRRRTYPVVFYWLTHSQKGRAIQNGAIELSNVSAEWLAAWSPVRTTTPVVSMKSTPFDANTELVNDVRGLRSDWSRWLGVEVAGWDDVRN